MGQTADERMQQKIRRELIMYGNWKQVSLAILGSIVLTVTSVAAAVGPGTASTTTSAGLAVTLVSGQAVI
jgi:hypothetical protein